MLDTEERHRHPSNERELGSNCPVAASVGSAARRRERCSRPSCRRKYISLRAKWRPFHFVGQGTAMTDMPLSGPEGLLGKRFVARVGMPAKNNDHWSHEEDHARVPGAMQDFEDCWVVRDQSMEKKARLLTRTGHHADRGTSRFDRFVCQIQSSRDHCLVPEVCH